MNRENRNVVQTTTLPLTSIGFILFLVFLILKLCNVLPPEFTWFWVWFPLWIPWAIELVLLGIVIVVILIIS